MLKVITEADIETEQDSAGWSVYRTAGRRTPASMRPCGQTSVKTNGKPPKAPARLPLCLAHTPRGAAYAKILTIRRKSRHSPSKRALRLCQFRQPSPAS